MIKHGFGKKEIWEKKPLENGKSIFTIFSNNVDELYCSLSMEKKGISDVIITSTSLNKAASKVKHKCIFIKGCKLKKKIYICLKNTLNTR